MTTRKTIMTIIIFLMISISGLLLWYKIFYPSYLSVQSSCGVIADDELEDRGFVTSGATIYNVSEDGTQEITLQIISESDSTLRHELCHVRQIQQGRLDTCEHKVFKIFDEGECYVLQYLPIFNDEIIEYRRTQDANNQTGN